MEDGIDFVQNDFMIRDHMMSEGKAAFQVFTLSQTVTLTKKLKKEY